MVKRLWKSSSTSGGIRRNTITLTLTLNEIHRTTTWTRNAISIRMFSAETTGPIFTKILHDIVAVFSHAYTRRYPIPFLSARATKVRSLPFFAQNWLPWQCPLIDIGKRGPDRSSVPKTLSFVKRLQKLVHGILRNLSPVGNLAEQAKKQDPI